MPESVPHKNDAAPQLCFYSHRMQLHSTVPQYFKISFIPRLIKESVFFNVDGLAKIMQVGG
jgi:hypothetical protein